VIIALVPVLPGLSAAGYANWLELQSKGVEIVSGSEYPFC